MNEAFSSKSLDVHHFFLNLIFTLFYSYLKSVCFMHVTIVYDISHCPRLKAIDRTSKLTLQPITRASLIMITWALHCFHGKTRMDIYILFSVSSGRYVVIIKITFLFFVYMKFDLEYESISWLQQTEMQFV